MVCPFCGGETARGAIFAQRDNAYWQSDAVKGWKRIVSAADADRVEVTASETFGTGARGILLPRLPEDCP